MKPGNGAREALDAMASQRLGVPGLSWADWVLAELWDRGFKVVPLDDPRKDCPWKCKAGDPKCLCQSQQLEETEDK